MRLPPLLVARENAFMYIHALNVIVLLTLLAGAGPLSAQDQPDHHEADHEALRAIRAVAEKAINNNELDLFRPLLADEFSIVTYTDREFSDFDKFKARWQQTRDELLAGGSYTTNLNPELSEIIGEVAIARGHAENVLTTGAGRRYEFTSHWTAVLHKVDGQWKVVRAHSSLSPFDNPMLHAGVQSALWTVGAIAAAAGLLIGCIGTWLLGRMRRRG